MTITHAGAAKPQNPYAQAYAEFTHQVGEHHLEVLHEDGVYRHLRVQAPGTRAWSWDITTWPGHLATSGDIADGFMFTRLYDMVEFFSSSKEPRHYSDGAPSIDFRYWAQKLCGGRSQDVLDFSEELFIKQVREHLDEHDELGAKAREDHNARMKLIARIHELRGLTEREIWELFLGFQHPQVAGDPHISAVYSPEWRKRMAAKTQQAHENLWSTKGLSDEQFDDLIENYRYHELGEELLPVQSPAERFDEVIADAKQHAGSNESAHAWLQENKDLFGSDTWEWDLRDFNPHFLYACYAIELTMRLYREHMERVGVNNTYVLVREGRVDNRPA